MPASSKISSPTGIAAILRQHWRAFSGAVVLALLLLGTAVVNPAALQIFALPGVERVHVAAVAAAMPDPSGSHWAGNLESPQAPPKAHLPTISQPEAPLTSAAYTSGFDRRAVGLGPLPPEAPSIKIVQPRDPHACPNDLNCSFRPVKAGAVAPQRPVVMAANTDAIKTAPPPTGLALLTARLHLPTNLPSANTLLKPFTFVGNIGNSVAGFVKKL
jgi:hypothetical protein